MFLFLFFVADLCLCLRGCLGGLRISGHEGDFSAQTLNGETGVYVVVV